MTPALTLQWQRLFGPKWATSENARGLRELLRFLGRSPSDDRAKKWLLAATLG